MKKTILSIAIIFILSACSQSTSDTDEATVHPKTSVEITYVHAGSVSDDLELFANTIYLKRNLVTAPIPAFITKVNVHLGDRVKQGDILYELESKERRALGNQTVKLDSTLTNFGIIKVKAPASGIVSTLEKQQPGDYALEGTQLCTIAESSDLAFQINVPYEFTQYVKQGKTCRIILPDNSIHPATVSTPLTSMNLLAQTQSILAKAGDPLFLPENLIVKVLISKNAETTKQVLPKSCVQSDEMMKEFWVMKLVNDSTAVKQPVTLGNKNQSEVEILTPQFNSTDKIVLTGAYGLADTALVKIINTKANAN